MNTINHLLGAVGRLLIWVAGALVLEELTLAGLARLIVRHVSEARVARSEARGAGVSARCSSAIETKCFQGETSWLQ